MKVSQRGEAKERQIGFTCLAQIKVLIKVQEELASEQNTNRKKNK